MSKSGAKKRWNEKWLVGEGNNGREGFNMMGNMDCKMYATGDAQKQGPFVLGTQNFKLESIKEHEKSQVHQHWHILLQPKSSSKYFSS